MTNREKLSKMSNEELVKIMMIDCFHCPYHEHNCSNTRCDYATLEWLGSEAEE